MGDTSAAATAELRIGDRFYGVDDRVRKCSRAGGDGVDLRVSYAAKRQAIEMIE